jgi:microcystin-dependent protein
MTTFVSNGKTAVEVGASVLLVPVGTILPTGNSVAPTGFLICDGTAVSRTTWADLFAVVGVTFGVGDGSTTFNLPDLRGRSPVGVGTGDAGGATAWALAEKGGAETHGLTTAELATHSHSHNHDLWDYENGVGALGLDDGADVNRGAQSRTIEDTMSTDATTAGSGSAHNTMHPVLGVNFIIKT